MLNKMKLKLAIGLTLLVLIVLHGCGGNNKSNAQHEKIITVSAKSISNSLYFSGIIQPLKTVVVTSPADGVIDDMTFHYGDPVNPSQPLFLISSEKFKTDYKTALMQYLKAKNEFGTAKSQLTESEFLHKNQLISDDDFKSKQSGYYNAQLSLVQSQDALDAMLKQMAVQGINIDQLRIENIDKINQALNLQGGSQRLRVISPASGVALLDIKNGGADDTKKIQRGDQVKEGDILAVIGDVSGLTIKINVNEFNVNELKIGQKVSVTGSAFPEIVLQGQITGIDRQGQPSTNGMPVFPVEIIVPKLTAAQQSVIHVGMSAKVEIQIQQPPEITLPINAIIQKQGMTFVRVQDKKTGKINEVAVKTGQTTMDSVVIQSNLSEGEKVVIPG